MITSATHPREPNSTGPDDPGWNRPEVAFNPPAPGFNSNDFRPGPTWRTENWPWLKGQPTQEETMNTETVPGTRIGAFRRITSSQPREFPNYGESEHR